MNDHRPALTIEACLSACANFWGVPTRELRDPSRARRLVRPRQAAAWVAAKLAEWPWSDIARALGRHPASVRHAAAEAERLRQSDPEFARLLELAMRRLKETHRPAAPPAGLVGTRRAAIGASA